MKTLAFRLAAAFLFALASLASAAPAFEKVVPDDTLAFLTVRNIPALEAKSKQQAYYAIWKEPDVQRFLEKPLQRLTEELQKGEGKTGVKLEEVWSLFHGQVALEVRQEPGAAAPEVVLLVDVAGDGERAMRLVATLNETAAKNAGPNALTPVEETYEGAKLVLMRKPATPGGGAAGPPVTFGLAGDVFLIGSTDAAVKRMVTFLNAPPAASLASTPGYQATLEKLSPDSDVFAFVNLARIVELRQQKSSSPQTPQILRALGLNGLACAGGGLAIDEQYWTSRLFVQTPGEREGILKILAPSPGPLHSGAEAPADAAGFFSMRFDPVAIWDACEKALGIAAPDTLTALNAQINQAAQQLGQPFSLRNDVLAVFGPRFAFYRRYEKPYNLATSEQIIFLVDIAGKAAFNGALDKINKIAPQLLAMFQPQEYLGQQVYVLTPPGPAGAPPPEGTARPAFVATDRELIISPRVEALEAHLRRVSGGGPTLQDRREFQDALKSLPAEGRTMIAFQDPAQQVEFFITVLREGGYARILKAFRGNPEVDDVAGLFDLSLLPDPTVVSKHLAPSASCAIVQQDGLLFIGRSKAKADISEVRKEF